MATLLYSFSLFALPPATNLDSLKKTLVQYHDSGQYNRDIAELLKPAKKYLIGRITHNPSHKKLAVVFDLDETLWSSYNEMVKNDFGQALPYVRAVIAQGNFTAIPPSKNFYFFVKQHHVPIFIVTARPEKLRAVTLKNLKYAGYYGWAHLYLSPERSLTKSHSTVMIKTALRKEITAQGYDIILNIGDQHSDLLGGYADKTIKLPNPFYFVP